MNLKKLSRISDAGDWDKYFGAISASVFDIKGGPKKAILEAVADPAIDRTKSGIENCDFLVYHYDERKDKAWYYEASSLEDAVSQVRELADKYIEDGEVEPYQVLDYWWGGDFDEDDDDYDDYIDDSRQNHNFMKFQKFIRDGKSGDEMYQLVRQVVSKDLIKRASKEILSWSGADRPGETVVVGPASEALDIFNWVHDLDEVDEDYLYDSGLAEKVAEFLGEDPDDDFDIEKYTDVLKKNPQLLAERGNPSQKYFLIINDWNDLGEDVYVGFCDEAELVELLVGGEGSGFGYYECPFGLYHTMVEAGLDPTKFKYLNTNDEFPELPTYEEVPKDVEKEIWSEAWGNYSSWD